MSTITQLYVSQASDDYAPSESQERPFVVALDLPFDATTNGRCTLSSDLRQRDILSEAWLTYTAWLTWLFVQ